MKGEQPLSQKGGDIAAEELAHRLGDDLERQGVAGIALHQLRPGRLGAKEVLIGQQLLAGWQLQATQAQQAYRGLVAAEDGQLADQFATGQ